MTLRRLRQGQLWDYLYYAAFAVVFLFLIWKCRYGYANIDEAFYLTIPYRLCLGDGLLIHEWHVSQLSGFLLYPLVKLYLGLFQGTEGILLRFRWIYTFIWGAAAWFLERRLRGYSKAGARVAALAFLIYAPFGIMALSYNSLGILTLLCACVMLLTARAHPRAQYVAAGALGACSILCCPYNLAIYGAFAAVALAFALKRQRRLLTCWLYATLGCLLVFCAFCLFVFTRCPPGKLPELIPWILKDPDHTGMTFIEKVKLYVRSIRDKNGFALYAVAACALLSLAGRVRKGWRPFCFAAMCLVDLLYLLGFEFGNAYLNFLMFPMALVGFYCAATSQSQAVRGLFWGLWVPGIMYTFLLNLSSNQSFYAISSAAIVATVAAIAMAALYLRDLASERGAWRRLASACLAALFLAQIGTELHLRYTSIFWETDPMSAQTVRVDHGPERGILMTPERAEKCRQLSELIRPIAEDGRVEKVFFATRETMSYLYAQKAFATYSAWLAGLNRQSLERLDAWYQINPDRLPDAVCLGDLEDGFYDYFLDRGYVPEPHEGYCYMRRAEL